MRDKEFNQNRDLEHSISKELEFVNTVEWKKSDDYTDQRSENVLAKKTNKKLMKLMLGTIGAVTIASSTGMFKQTSNLGHDHSQCKYSTEYNDLFDDITTLMTFEDRALAAERIDSDEMKQWLDEISPGEERNRCSFIYNKEYVTDCPTEVYENDYDSDTSNLYFIVTINDGEGYDGKLKNEYEACLTPKLNMTKEYLEQAGEIDTAYIQVTNYIRDQRNRGISILDNMPQEKIYEILVRNNIQDTPPRIQFEKLTITGYLEGRDYQETRDFASLSSDEQIIYKTGRYTISSEYLKYGPDVNSPLTLRGKLYGTSVDRFYEYTINDSGQVTIIQSYWIDSNGEQHELPHEPGYQLYVNDMYSSLTRKVFALQNQE